MSDFLVMYSKDRDKILAWISEKRKKIDKLIELYELRLEELKKSMVKEFYKG